MNELHLLSVPTSTERAPSPWIIFQEKTHIEGKYHDEALPHNQKFEISQDGLFSDEVGQDGFRRLNATLRTLAGDVCDTPPPRGLRVPMLVVEARRPL